MKSDSIPRGAWLILTLLFFVQMINFIDKSVVGVAGATIMHELGLTPVQFGWVGSSFFALYALSGVIISYFAAPRVAPRLILTALMFIWIIAQIPVLVFGTLTSLIISRLVLGVGEGAGTPTAINVIYEWFPSSMRSTTTAILFFGNICGTIVGAPLLSYAIVAFGWQAAFATCAILGSIMLTIWMLVASEGPGATITRKSPTAPPDGRREQGVPERILWTDPTVIGIVVVSFCAYATFSFNVSWLAPYLRLGLGFNTIDTGWMLALIHTGQAVFLLLLPAYSDRLVRRGASQRMARGVMIGASLAISGVAAFLAAIVPNISVKIGLLILATGLPHIALALAPSVIGEVAPAARRNQLIGLIFSGVTVSGLIAPAVIGYLVEAFGYSASLFLISGVAIFGGAVALALIFPERTKQRFSSVAISTTCAGT